MIQQDLFAALAGVAGGRVFPNVAPNNVQKPYVVYARVSNAPENTLADGAPVAARMRAEIADLLDLAQPILDRARAAGGQERT